MIKNIYEELMEYDLNPYFLFNSDGKLKSYNIEAEFLLNFVSVKELFELAISNAPVNNGFQQKYIPLKYDKQSYYAILVGYVDDEYIALRVYKLVSTKQNDINNNKLKVINIFTLIDLSKKSTLITSSLQIDEVYDISIPEMKLDINNFLICLNSCFEYFSKFDIIKLFVNIKVGEYELIDNKKTKILEIKFISTEIININRIIEEKAIKANINLFVSNNILRLELPIIL